MLENILKTTTTTTNAFLAALLPRIINALRLQIINVLTVDDI
jgi:hypothetical protein